MAISPALRGIIRPPHRLGGVAKSRSLFVAPSPLILALLDEQIDFGEKSVKTSAFKWLQKRSGSYLTGQVIAAYSQVRLTPRDFGGSRKTGFRKVQLASYPF
jgi:hypothetical protein